MDNALSELTDPVQVFALDVLWRSQRFEPGVRILIFIGMPIIQTRLYKQRGSKGPARWPRRKAGYVNWCSNATGPHLVKYMTKQPLETTAQEIEN